MLYFMAEPDLVLNDVLFLQMVETASATFVVVVDQTKVLFPLLRGCT